YRRLAAAGVTCRVVGPVSFRNSLLSEWYFAGAEYVPFETSNSIPSLVVNALAGDGPRYVVAYWPEYDGVCHRHGPFSAQAGDEAAAIDLAIRRLADSLPRTKRTLLIVTADHGQRDLDPAEAIVLNDDTR